MNFNIPTIKSISVLCHGKKTVSTQVLLFVREMRKRYRKKNWEYRTSPKLCTYGTRSVRSLFGKHGTKLECRLSNKIHFRDVVCARRISRLLEGYIEQDLRRRTTAPCSSDRYGRGGGAWGPRRGTTPNRTLSARGFDDRTTSNVR